MAAEPRTTSEVDFYGAQYGRFRSELLAAVRAEAFGEDYGQNGWQTADELDQFAAALELRPGRRLLDVACGSGGPALRLAERTGCGVLGVDLHADAVATARAAAAERGLAGRARFVRADAAAGLPLAAGRFDALLCVDAINHLPDRARTLAAFARALEPGGRLLFTDPVVVAGPVTAEELRARASIGPFLFVPPGADERAIAAAGLELLEVRDRTPNVAATAERWRAARAARAEALREIEGAATFDGQQRFLAVTARLAAEGRLARLAFLARKPERVL